MRIDLNPSSMPEISRGGGSAAAAGRTNTNEATQASNGSEDVAQLSTGSDAVQALRARLETVPEVRQARVESLRNSIRDGSFEVLPERIAEAMAANSGM